jgi:hypothetical protein
MCPATLVSAKDNTQQIVVLSHRTSYQTDLCATYAHICKLFLSYLCFPAKWFLSLRPNSGAPRKIHMRPPGLLIVEVSASSTIEQDSSMARISKNSPTTSSWDGHFHSYLKIMATNLQWAGDLLSRNWWKISVLGSLPHSTWIYNEHHTLGTLGPWENHLFIPALGLQEHDGHIDRE